VVLAGHSFGGLYVETYAAQYPDDVAGMVLIDPTPAASPPVATPEQTGADDLLGRVSALVSATARFGVTRLYAQLDYGELPTRSRDEVRASIRTAGTFRSTLDEYLVASDSMARAAQLTDLGDTPLVVLTAGIGSDAEFTQHHEELARLSTESVHRVVDGASHGSMVSDEEDAAGTTQAILEVVAVVRGQAGLAD
jgi:pimeloyl-ACP methyl ester carboxylesterase